MITSFYVGWMATFLARGGVERKTINIKAKYRLLKINI